MSAGLWRLEEDTASLAEAAASWTTLSRAARRVADDFSTARKKALADWTGEAAESFHAGSSSALYDLDKVSSTAAALSSTLLSASGAVSSARGQLESSWMRISGIFRLGSFFFPRNDNERTLLEREENAALQIRESLEQELSEHSRAITESMQAWNDIASQWKEKSSGIHPFIEHMPSEKASVGITLSDGQAVVSAGNGNNQITVSIDPGSGDQIVTIDGISYRIPAGNHLTIRGEGGQDTITLPSQTSIGFTVAGGAGLDRITGSGGGDRIFGYQGDDEIQAGSGADYVSGGNGHDYLDGQEGDDRLFGGADRDCLYGLAGSDHLSGGLEQDYLEGGTGSDLLDGGHGNDVLSGGQGDDRVFGGDGDDVSYGGLGRDRSIGGTGEDTSYDHAAAPGSSTERNITIEIPRDTPFIKVEGSPEFIARVEADLDLMRSSPAGQALLETLQKSHDDSGFLWWGKSSLTITEFQKTTPDDYNSLASRNGNNFSVKYLPTFDDFRGAPPVVILQHELGHVYDYAHGTLRLDPYLGESVEDHKIKVAERQATGLPIDHDGDPSTPEIIDPAHPFPYTENGLRQEMGLPKRESYR